jgi:hypothetical protein
MATWVIAYGPWTRDTPIGEVPVWGSCDLLFPLDAAASCSLGGVPSAAAVGILEGQTDVWVYRNDALVFRGRVVAGNDVLEGRDEVAFQVLDYRGLLAARIARTDLTFTAVPQADLAWGLVQHTQGQPGGDLGVTRQVDPPAGRERDRFYDAGQTIGEALDNLGRVQDGFDWDVSPHRVFRVHYPRRGRALTEPLVLGASLARLERLVDMAGFANAVRVSGGEGTVGTVAVAADVATDPRGLWEAQVGLPSVVEQATVDERAARMLADRSMLRPSYRATFTPGRLVEVPTPGDTADLAVRAGRIDEAGRVRIMEVAVDVGPDRSEVVTAALVWDEEPPIPPNTWRTVAPQTQVGPGECCLARTGPDPGLVFHLTDLAGTTRALSATAVTGTASWPGAANGATGLGDGRAWLGGVMVHATWAVPEAQYPQPGQIVTVTP